MNLLVDRPPGAVSRLHLSEIDRQVAARIRTRRIMLGMTMQQLATMVGVTYQQLYKYESGTNRVAAGRLLPIARALDVAPSYFFEDTAESPEGRGHARAPSASSAPARLQGDPSRRLQAALCSLARAVAATRLPGRWRMSRARRWVRKTRTPTGRGDWSRRREWGGASFGRVSGTTRIGGAQARRRSGNYTLSYRRIIVHQIGRLCHVFTFQRLCCPFANSVENSACIFPKPRL